MSNVVLIRRKRRKRSVFSFFRRKVFTAAQTQPHCMSCDMGHHHPGKPKPGCHCRCGSR